MLLEKIEDEPEAFFADLRDWVYDYYGIYVGWFIVSKITYQRHLEKGEVRNSMLILCTYLICLQPGHLRER